jgi:hypothetical protein
MLVFLMLFFVIAIYSLIIGIKTRKYRKELDSKAKSVGMRLPWYHHPEPSKRKVIRAFMLTWSSIIDENDTEEKVRDKEKIHKYYLNYSKLFRLFVLFIAYIVIFVLLIR